MELNIQIEETKSKGRAFVAENNEVLAEMTYSMAGENLMIIDHTHVGEALQGQGIGRQLLDVLVKKARSQAIKIMPLCPFAKSVFEKDETIRDVLMR
jgi:predicted GNAT family acetyltransferase